MSSIFLLWVLFVSAWCWGFYNAFKPKEVMGLMLKRPMKYLRETLPEWLQNPLFDCAICMASVHGTIWYIIGMVHFEQLPKDFFLYILFIVSVSGINYCISKMQYED